MHPDQHPENARRQILDALVHLGTDPSATLRETILIREGYYCGRRFQFGRFEAIWFFEEDEVKFYGPEGTVIRVCRPSDLASQPQRRVA